MFGWDMDAVPTFFYQIDYCIKQELPSQIGYFHAQWRRQRMTELTKDYVILDNVAGKGKEAYLSARMILQVLHTGISQNPTRHLQG